MARASKKAPPRKPVRARGALPAPRVAPQRNRTVWYRRPPVMVVGALIILGLLGLGVKVFLDQRAEDKQRVDDQRAVRQFENAVNRLRAGMAGVLDEINTSPQQLQTGQLSADEFRKQTDAWIEEIRKVDAGLRRRQVPSRLTGLDEARALLVDGTLIYLDAAKAFQLASHLTDPAQRDIALQQARNLRLHADSVFEMGQRALLAVKQRYADPTEASETSILGPVQLPEEEAPVPAPEPVPPPEQPAP